MVRLTHGEVATVGKKEPIICCWLGVWLPDHKDCFNTRRLGHGDNTSYVNPKLIEALKDDIIFELSCACWHSVAVVLIPPLLKGGLVKRLPHSLDVPIDTER